MVQEQISIKLEVNNSRLETRELTSEILRRISPPGAERRRSMLFIDGFDIFKEATTSNTYQQCRGLNQRLQVLSQSSCSGTYLLDTDVMLPLFFFFTLLESF